MHIAIIMDGNGRWATARHLPRSAGHRAGAQAVNVTVEAAARARISTLTLYAFSAANWERPMAEVDRLFTLLRRYLLTQTQRCLEQSIRVNVIGRRDRIPVRLRQVIEHSERVTAECSGMHLRLAVDYSSQRSILATCGQLPSDGSMDRPQFLARMAAVDHSVVPAPAVDLLIRTGGEKRLSDFLLWECAYAELLFVDRLWPDFGADDFEQALTAYAGRDRRFGRVPDIARAHHG
jgi:undecaprenyl diphosphate synthase